MDYLWDGIVYCTTMLLYSVMQGESQRCVIAVKFNSTLTLNINSKSAALTKEILETKIHLIL